VVHRRTCSDASAPEPLRAGP